MMQQIDMSIFGQSNGILANESELSNDSDKQKVLKLWETLYMYRTLVHRL